MRYFKHLLGAGATALSLTLGMAYGQDIFIDDLEEAFQEPNRPRIEEKGEFISELELYLTDTNSSQQTKMQLGKKLVGLLDEECDSADYFLMDTPAGRDLVVRCYKEDKYGSWAVWGLNLDNTCRLYARLKKFGVMDISALVVAELSGGEVSSRKMKPSSARELVKIVDNYLKDNEDRCQYWSEFIQENYGIPGVLGAEVRE